MRTAPRSRITACQNGNTTAISAYVSARSWHTVTVDSSPTSTTAICASSGLSMRRGSIIANRISARSLPKGAVQSPCVIPMIRPAYCPFCLGDKSLPADERLASWTRDHHLWTHVNNDHAPNHVWPALCPHPLCDDPITDDKTLWQHLVNKHGLSYSRPDAIKLCKREHPDEAGFLEWTPGYGLSSSKRSRLATSTISPRLLPEPTSATCQVEDTECLTDLGPDETSLDGCIADFVKSAHLEITDTCSAGDNFISQFLRPRSPSCTSSGEFSGGSSDTAVDPITNENLPTPCAEPLSEHLDHNFGRANKQTDAIVKPIRIRLRVNAPPQRPTKTK